GTSSFAINSAPAPQSVASLATTTFAFPITLGGANGGVLGDQDGDIVLHGGGTAPGAQGQGADSADIAVQIAALFSYVDKSVAPTTVASGQSKVFTAQVDKTGSVGVNFTKASTTFSFTGLSTSLNTPASVGSGDVSGTTLTFNAATIPSVPTSPGFQAFTPSLKIVGVDANGAAVSQTLTPN